MASVKGQEHLSKEIVIRLTSGRILKGLLAIAKRYSNLFPDRRGKVTVFLDDESVPQKKTFSPFESSTRENRIGGLKHWFKRHAAQAGDQVLLIPIDIANHIYRLVFRRRAEEESRLRGNLMAAETETQAETAIADLARLRRQNERRAALSELQLLAQQSIERRRVSIKPRERYEGVPVSIRTLLKRVYDGKCQICGFTFRKRDGEPYFEVHHVDADGGHNPQNLLLLCPNCHAQMEHRKVEILRDSAGWIVTVIINGEERPVYQAMARGRRQTVIPAIVFLPMSLWTLHSFTRCIGV